MSDRLLSDEFIAGKIYIIRNQKVMLDKDLAILYEVTTGNLNKAVSRNIKRFPVDFRFQLKSGELENLIFHSGKSEWQGTIKPPFAFTEQGVAMLSGILNSDRAISVNIQITRTFIQVRQLTSDHSEQDPEVDKIKQHLTIQDKNFELVFRYLDELLVTKSDPGSTRTKIGFKPEED